VAALLRQLQISIELAAESVRVLPDRTGEMVDLCLDHLAHARALAGLIAQGCASGTVSPGLREPIEEPPADGLVGLVGRARAAATEACLAASSADEVEMFGMIAAALAGHEVVLRRLGG
jgi:hypothetical protein